MRILSLKTLTSGTAVSYFQSVMTQTFRTGPMLMGLPFYLKSLYQHKYEVMQVPELLCVSTCIVIIIKIWEVMKAYSNFTLIINTKLHFVFSMKVEAAVFC
jgi:hypothetical protein